MKKLPLLLLLGLSLGFVSCASRTPQTRIAENPTAYETLSPKHKELVSQGLIQKGMSKPAVFLALGAPHSKSAGEGEDGFVERWNYRRMKPVMRHHFSGFFGRGYGRPYGYHPYGYGRYRYRHSGFGYSPSISYISVPSSYVIFKNDRVSEWQRRSGR